MPQAIKFYVKKILSSHDIFVTKHLASLNSYLVVKNTGRRPFILFAAQNKMALRQLRDARSRILALAAFCFPTARRMFLPVAVHTLLLAFGNIQNTTPVVISILNQHFLHTNGVKITDLNFTILQNRAFTISGCVLHLVSEKAKKTLT